MMPLPPNCKRMTFLHKINFYALLSLRKRKLEELSVLSILMKHGQRIVNILRDLL